MDSTTIALVAAHPDDAEQLVALRIAAMRDSLTRIGRFDPQRARERFLSGYSPAHTRHIEAGGQRVGFVVVRPQPNALLLDHLYIHPNSQGQGLGASVLARIIDEARAQALPLRVGALRDSDSNRFYLRHGFKLVGQEEFDNYYLLTMQ
ncbi:GNAT family N-acetyltransferase [Janthinobacterium psychrotolerans]|uniref:Acetyltransferase (GNAT) domain-containing protein n=1 Tax=Janthinobacterium psychrotolerans TaxID=1747903 RepID=A0A1A7BYU0_9BURK|nr:GNAT family N-acetyltransferase [Janthinobacterium psychrotolerans]OBV38697.1 Acetyltransferase (GNAT) domain-containing protein [Janthinobacterium psychrotolerans]